MDYLIDSLDPEKWQTIEASAKGEGFKEYRVMRQYKEEPKGTVKLFLLDEKDEMVTPLVVGCKQGHNPLKNVGTCEVKIDDDGNVLGIDVEGDIAVKK